MTVWTLPIALLLPTPYALLAPIPNDLWTQWRVRKAVPHRRVFSAASIGLTHAGAGALFRLLAGAHPFAGSWTDRPEFILLVALAAGAAGEGANTALVDVAIHVSAPDTPWREILPGRDVIMLAGVEICTGVAVTVLARQAPAFVVLAVPAMILLHRSLLHSQLQVAARTDPKTGLLNAAAWQQQVDREIDRCRRDGRTLAVLVLDVDHFKAVNDRYGHLVGDQVLVELAEVLRRELRPSDTIGRFGGEEFVVAIPAGPSRAMAIAGRLCRRIAVHVAEVGADEVRITASIGVAMLGADGADATELLAAADRALYAAKAAGRNRVVAARGQGGAVAS
ncbi:MAG: GGDEF domain-containing protein [Mycobacteriales bacterium]